MKKILALLLLTIPLLALAQEDDSENMQIRGNIKFVNNSGEQVDGPSILWYGILDKMVAAEAYHKFQVIMGSDDPDRDLKIEDLRKEYNIDSRARKGQFKKNVIPTMSLIFVNDEDYEVMKLDVEKGKTQYKDVVMELKKQIKNVESVGNLRALDIAVASTDDADDGYERFNVHIKKYAGTARTDSRLIIQAFAVDCSSGDTIDYLSSLVYEGEKYHQVQNKRMGFNYEKNDKLAKYYHSGTVLREEDDFELKTTILWKKPSTMANRSFRGPYTYVFEDFHHPYYREDVESNCLKRRPFKMLDFTAAMHELELTQDFYAQAESQFQKKNTIINLRFEKGTSNLIQDSLNFVERDKFVKEITSYGKSLVEVTIIGGASPEGSAKRNEELARQRAGVAKSMLGHISVTPHISSQVYTWADVVKELRAQEKTIQADKVDEIIQAGGDEISWFNQIKVLPFYEYDIVPVLNKQRAMLCKYMYQNNRPMEPEECVQAFRTYKKQYWNAERHFSTGDFYNLYDQLTDSLEIDTLTTIAYNEIKTEVDYEKENAMAPYVFNLMSIQQMKRGTPNVEILRPFVNLTRRGKIGAGQGINYKYNVPGRGMVKFNYAEIIANQAVCYYMEQKVDTALFLIEWLKECKLADKGTEQLEDMINLKKLHFKNTARSAKEEADYQRAKSNVLALGNDNKAILYTEIEEWGGRDNAMIYINRMEDNNPKKWYLKGLMAAIQLAEKKTEEPLIVTSDDNDEEDDEEATDEFYRWPDDKLTQYQAEQFDDPAKEKALQEYLKKLQAYKDAHDGQEPPLAPAGSGEKKKKASYSVNVDKFKGIPQYLAYFQHAFDLDPTKKFRRYYEAEAHVNGDLRKVYKYKLKNRDLYREMFTLLKKRDSAMASMEANKESKENAEKKENASKSDNIETTEETKEESKK